MNQEPLFTAVESVLRERSESQRDQFLLVHGFPAREPRYVSWPRLEMPSPICEVLSREFPDGLYHHQARAIGEAVSGRNVVVTSQTSSGKSLIYTIPIVRAMLDSENATALLFFPTKALTNDQLQTLRARIPAILATTGKTCLPNLVARYDGATPEPDRKIVRQDVRVLLTNPDMAHLTLLAWHEKHWQRFIKNLKYVVLDEAHEYRGTFGSNVSMLIRRLLMLCGRYGSNPRFIATSATIASPAEHLRLLTGQDFVVVPPEDDGSRQGPKRFWVARPAGHAFATARALMERLVEDGKSVIAFCLSRWSAEENAEYFRDDPDRRICVYRAGLLSGEREKIEEGLRTGSIKGVFATNALELGIDIGLLDVCICVGFPNTMMSLWQRAGRVGRAGRPGAVILIPEARPIDAYFAEHHAELFKRLNEPLALNMNSPTLAKWHYACALNEARGSLDMVRPQLLGEPLATVAQKHQNGSLDDTLFHSTDPHHEYDMRAGGDSVYKLLEGIDRKEVGQINLSQIAFETAPNAIYRHNLERFRVLSIHKKPNEVRLRREHSFNRTRAFVNRKIDVLHCCGARKNPAMQLEECDRLRVMEMLLSLTEKSPDGTVVHVWNGPQGLMPYILPTSGVVLTVHDPVAMSGGADSSRPSSMVAREAWNGLAPLLTGMLPSVLGPCDLGDFAIHSEWADHDARLFFYDRAYDGIDLTLPTFDRLDELLKEAMVRIQDCECIDAEGCFRCVKHAYEDLPTNRKATEYLVRALIESLSRDAAQVTFREGRSMIVADAGENLTACSSCGQKNAIGSKFCSNCGEKLIQL